MLKTTTQSKHGDEMLKFIPTDVSKFGQKRKQCQRACEACRRKKKRCSHVDSRRRTSGIGSQEGSSDHLDDVRIDSISHFTTADLSRPSHGYETGPSNLDGDSSDSRGTTAFPQTGHIDREKLHGDSNEEAELVLGSRFIGDLNPEGMFLAATSPTATTGADKADKIGIWLTERLSRSHESTGLLTHEAEASVLYGFDPLIHKVMIPLLAEECLTLLPPQPELEKLCSIYFDKHHPIFPVVDEHSFRAMGHTKNCIILLQQGLCLVASLNPSAKSYLCLPKVPTPLHARDFGRRVSAAMRTSIELGFVTKKIVIIQALALLSFYIDGPNGGDVSSQLCGRAVHYVHSIGLHIESRSQGQDDRYSETLLCCIWALDRLNAALHGRPVIMHERDIGRNLEACIQTQNVCFRLFLRIIVLLDEVICLYRPSTNRNAESSSVFPLFEELIEEFGGSQIPTPLLVTIETLYHAIAILSCRTKFPSEPQFSSTSNLRQRHSATQIASIVSPQSRNQLSWFSFVPYAVSLSLSVAYREMRHSKIPMYRARARSEMVLNCNILQDIQEVSWSAGIMAEMGKATLMEMDRVYHEVASGRERRNETHPCVEGANGQDESRTGTRVETLTPVPDHESVSPTPDASWTSLAGNGDFYDTHGFESSLPLDLADLDVFALFDPNFDLDGIDALLGGNLDISMPNALQ